jgi:NTP pyrophosphatase (non-canonical NTP hydrolase)
MNLIDYELAVEATASKELDDEEILVNSALGLAGESGEIADFIKKYKFHGKPFDRDYVVKELGDILWYVTWMAQTINSSLEEVMLVNMAKLKARYPDGFSTEASENRNTEIEALAILNAMMNGEEDDDE